MPRPNINHINPSRSISNAANSNPSSRLSLISRHLVDQQPLNTPYTTERLPNTIDTSLLPKTTSRKMSSQPEHPTLLIPGPIEFDDAVLHSMSHYSESHVGPAFVATFGETLSMLRKLFQTTDPASQPFVISGSGTLGWDLVAANLVEAGDDVLVLSTGYFSDGFADCLGVYGAKVTEIKAPVGQRPQLPEIERALSEKKYKVLTVTHVDTSTGVLSELKKLSELVHRVSPDTLVIVDGVCSVACEEIAFDEWKLDGVVTASQKAIGCPAGLSISMFSGRAIQTLKNRKTPPSSYFGSLKNWLPIMQNYEAKKPSYFATPSPQLVHALHTALTQILTRPVSERFAKHREASDRIKKAVADLGLKQLAANPDDQAHGMTAIYLPENVKGTELLPKLGSRGVVFAGGIHKEVAAKYIRFGHMGVSVLEPERGHVEKALKALEDGLAECGYQKA
ncbi:PLP-dependent transferase [Coniochaeta ligniaria NRRL 30616]|uniref:alanine--glyoxylate transaminase n=1 Tax=Coniochaeta ligniaria NRRL 30616 TaxID=1408157 RepID=A0A1J7IJG7_9PEZI|nr:PLP-dependent transferase [Coniochaeta ligniaria NRRL 30616]